MRPLKKLRSNATYANVVATFCLFLLLGGGTAFASMSLLPRNSVGPRQLKKGAVTSAKISKRAKRALTGSPGVQGLRGPAGPTGPAGPVGSLGTSVPLAIDASAAEFPLSTTSSDLALEGTTSWTAASEPAGLLVAQLKAKLATNGEFNEFCSALVEIFDNGEPVTTLNLGVGTYTPENSTLKDYRTTPTPVGIGLVDHAATHTITAKYSGGGAAGCIPGSKFEGLRIIVQPLG